MSISFHWKLIVPGIAARERNLNYVSDILTPTTLVMLLYAIDVTIIYICLYNLLKLIFFYSKVWLVAQIIITPNSFSSSHNKTLNWIVTSRCRILTVYDRI